MEKVRYLWKHEVEILLLSLLFTMSERYWCSQGLCVAAAPLCYTSGAWLCAGKGCGMETRDTNGCCDSPLFLFCWCVTGKLGRKSSTASSGDSPSTSCSTLVSCLWLLIFFYWMAQCCLPWALSPCRMPQGGWSKDAYFEHTSALAFPRT